MNTAAEFQARLQELQNEQKELKASKDSSKKVVRTRIQEINVEFIATKKEWRDTLGDSLSKVSYSETLS